MAQIFPFRPYRYSAAAGPIENLVTQPYDKISPQMQSRYLSLSPHNLVRVILGERNAGDTEADNVYTRSAAYFNQWISTGILKQDEAPGFYAYFQDFEIPGTSEVATRKGFIGLGKIEDYSAGIVHRHEQTLSGPKKDRMQVLSHTGAHFGQLFMLYPDPAGAIDRILDSAAAALPSVQLKDEYNTTHRLWAITDPATISEIQSLMGDKKLLIADGHHRYETALAYRNAHPGNEAAEKVMMTFVNMHSTGLKILATHRLVSNLEDFDLELFLDKVRPNFTIHVLDSLEQLKAAWAEPHDGLMRIGLAVGGHLWMLEKPKGDGDLDVTTLHTQLLEQGLGITPEAVREESYITYMRGLESALEKVRCGEVEIAFLLEPTKIEEVAGISFGGGVMPQKSTDFYPKLLTGLTIYKL